MSNKIDEIKKSFSFCKTREEIYRTIIDWGKKLSSYNPEWERDENLVSGCQSVMYLHDSLVNGKMVFYAYSDALISAGLAALLIYFYNEETPEFILRNPPLFLQELNIPTSLTPGRANGLASLYIKMKQAALNYLMLSVK